MADTKISALAAASAVAGANEFPINEAGTTKKVTGTQVATFVNTAPVFAAGTATAGTWPKFTVGTVLTTAEDGAIEMDADCFYGCTDAGNRGVIPIRNLIRADATVTQANDASAHAIFTTPTNGRLTLETGTYLFSGLLAWSAMSATSGNIKIDILGAGTATIGAWLWRHLGLDVAPAQAAANLSGGWTVTSASVASAVNAAVNTGAIVEVNGTFEVTGAGTIIPTQTLATAAAAVLSIGSFLMFERIGSTSATNVGQWD